MLCVGQEPSLALSPNPCVVYALFVVPRRLLGPAVGCVPLVPFKITRMRGMVTIGWIFEIFKDFRGKLNMS